MDWTAAIEIHREALQQILATLVAMAGLSAGPHPEVRSLSGSEGEPRRTLPRHLHSAILRLLRPAESAARRLIIVAARGLLVTLPPPRPSKPNPAPIHSALRSLGIAVTLSPADIARAAADARAAAARAARPRGFSFSLLDPLRTPFRPRRITVPAHRAPRIWSFGDAEPHPLPPPPSPDNPVNARRLNLRLAALASALDDLPRQARRFARWKARSDASRDAVGAQNGDPRDASRDASRDAAGAQSMNPGVQNMSLSAQNRRTRVRRLGPLRPGPAYGLRRPGSRRRAHQVDEVLRDTHYFALRALAGHDTS